MNNNTPTDQELKGMLSPRSVPPHDEQFARRIVAAAARLPQRETFWRRVSSVFEEFKIPAPAYSMAAIFIVGFAAGLGAFGDIGSGLFMDDTGSSAIEFLLEEDNLL